MRNCPEVYYDNCHNALKLCSACHAGTGNTNSRLRYSPIEERALPGHPVQIELEGIKREERKNAQAKKLAKKKTVQSKNTRLGYRKEKETKDRLNKKVNAIEGTLRSGAVHGDGDYKVQGGLQGDHKYRIANKRSFGITREEYRKGLAEGTDHWLITITNKDTQTDETVVILTEEAYCRLLALSKFNETDRNA